MSINNLDCSILNEIIKNESVFPGELVKKYNTTDRNIRYKLDNINFYLNKEKLPVIKTTAKGELFFGSEDRILLENSTFIIKDEDYIFSKDERQRLVLIFILLKTGTFTIQSVLDEIGVSLSTLKNDIRELKLILGKIGLKLVQIAKKGLKVHGSEDSIRRMILNILLESGLESFGTDQRDKIDVFKRNLKQIFLNSYSGTKAEKEESNLQTERAIREYLEEINEDMNEKFSDVLHNYIMNYLRLMILRIRNKKYLKEDLDDVLFLENIKEHKIIKSHINILENKADIKLTPQEIIKIVEIYIENKNYDVNNSWKQVKQILENLISKVSSDINLDMTNDLILLNDLIYHMKLAAYRIKNNIKLKNSIYKEVEDEVPFLFGIVEKRIAGYEQYLDEKLNKDEIAFITIHFKMSIDRNYNLGKKRILIVCGLGYGTSKLLKKIISEEFNVEITDLIPVYQLEKYNLDKTDIILSTVKIKELPDKPYLTINTIPNLQDKKNIEQLGIKRKNASREYYMHEVLKVIKENCDVRNSKELTEGLEKIFSTEDEKIMESHRKNLLELLPKENIKVVNSVKNWQEAMEISGRILVDNGYTEWEYVESVIDMVYKHGTYMVLKKNFILGHGNYLEKVRKAGLSFLYIKEGVEFPENHFINCVITLCSRDKKEHTFGLLELHRVIENCDLYKKISEKNSGDEVYREIKSGWEKIKI